jgi:two-component system phosphate regulon sensor histidine kinase PhoR
MITSETIATIAWVETAYLLTDNHWRICYASDSAGQPFGTSAGELEGRSLPELLGRDIFEELRRTEASAQPYSAITLHGRDYIISIQNVVGSTPLVNPGTRDGTGTQSGEQASRLPMHVVELREAEASLTAVISQIIHELKNPLSAMQALVQSLEEDLKEDSNARQYTSRLVSEIERLGRLLSSMAHFSRLKYRPTKVFSLLSLVRYISDLFEQDFRRRNITLQVVSTQNVVASTPLANPGTRDGQDVQFRGDGDQIAQLFVNLITNAVEAMPKGGVITVNLTTMQDGTVGIKVADTGIGMSKERLEHITRSLVGDSGQAPSAMLRSARVGDAYGLETFEGEGMGLGLSIVRSIVRQHGGRMTLSSDEGLGSEVTITFPAL